ncbi:hypothetical protein [Gemmatimonas groenlandica]|uniref:Lipoprotein n=1 Tax=Gemmatimonas groenlandica TaxID=2732249 RepID=A0A6M4IMR7_9BACT|nr:hypothetical protein [Gemmatimonas groenlandica]QJR34312.1 hypothetical protein HKW67_01630 [Gemmatimonas groenlandica]
MTSRVSPRVIAASILFVLATTRVVSPLTAQDSTKQAQVRATKPAGSTLKPDSGPKYAYPATGTSAAARALAGKPVPVWPVPGPAPLPGSVLPAKRIIAYYGNPFSKRMGVLGEYPKPEMLAMLDREVAAWTKADPSTPVQPALHLITTVAQGDAGKDGKYRMRHGDALTEKVYGWAKERNALLFLDVQVGLSTIQEELPRLESWLSKRDVHFGMDPEFAMKNGTKPGRKIGSYDAADVNWAIDYLAKLVTEKKLPPKILVVHRFTKPMLTNATKIKRDPRVQVVMHMDGWGPPSLKRDSYAAYVYAEPVQFAGFKLFYKNDRRSGSTMMTPRDLLALTPRPLYIQYQ